MSTSFINNQIKKNKNSVYNKDGTMKDYILIDKEIVRLEEQRPKRYKRNGKEIENNDIEEFSKELDNLRNIRVNGNKSNKQIKLVNLFNFPKLKKRKNKKIKRNTKSKFIKIRPFKEIYFKDDSLTKQENHKKYLKSGVWKRRRIFILKKRGCKCENCGYKPKQKFELHIHHRTYRKWGAEYQNHLKIMCKDCHNKLHDKYTVTELEDLFSAGKNPKV